MTTSQPLTLFDMQESGQFSEAHLASQPVEPGSSEAMQMTAGSGRRLSESFPLSGPLGRCSRILLASETWASPEFYLTWKVKATRQGCSVFQLAPSAPRTDANGTGLWPTPDSSMASGGRQSSMPGQTYRENGTKRQTTLNKLAHWPTPRAEEREQHNSKDAGMSTGAALRASWPTPKTPQGSACRADKNMKHLHRLDDVVPKHGEDTYGCLARTESFVVCLMILSMWLMGYTAHYLRHWETASSRRLQQK